MARAAPSDRTRQILEILAKMGPGIFVPQSSALRANLVGTPVIAGDGDDPFSLRLMECRCHMHVDWNRVASVAASVEDLGYGNEGVLSILDESGKALAKVYYKAEQLEHLPGVIGTGAVNDLRLEQSVEVDAVALSPGATREGIEVVRAQLRGLGIKVIKRSTTPWDPESAAKEVALSLRGARPKVLWSTLGGVGCVSTLRVVTRLRLPQRPRHRMVAFSDASSLAAWLYCNGKIADYVYWCNMLDEGLFRSRHSDIHAAVVAIRGGARHPRSFHLEHFAAAPGRISGRALPINLTALEALLCIQPDCLPPDSVLFVEDVNDTPDRVRRRLENLKSLGVLNRVRAFILGEFIDTNGDVIPPPSLVHAFSGLGRPVAYLGEFGHGQSRLPLIAGCPVRLEITESAVTLVLLPS